jgi:hypothetical protein
MIILLRDSINDRQGFKNIVKRKENPKYGFKFMPLADARQFTSLPLSLASKHGTFARLSEPKYFDLTSSINTTFRNPVRTISYSNS